MSFFLILISLFFIEFLYFKIAYRFNIVDKPNHRSSHSEITIRGGGIIFPLAVIICVLLFGNLYPYFFAGLLLISFISFLDDIKHVANVLRLGVHLLAVLLLFVQIGILNFPIMILVIAIVLSIAIINAVNFMDGINGLTTGYALVALVTLGYLNLKLHFIAQNYILLVISSLLVFTFFNFRTKAKCFAGDVGSVSIAFIIIFFLLMLILRSNSLSPVLFLLVYLLDAFTTIMFRLFKGENIFTAHRSHYYQFLANEQKLPQLLVAGMYCLTQIIINIVLLTFNFTNPIKLVVVLIVSAVVFVGVRFLTEGPGRLLKIHP